MENEIYCKVMQYIGNIENKSFEPLNAQTEKSWNGQDLNAKQRQMLS